MPEEFQQRLQRGLRAHASRAHRPVDPVGDVRRRMRRQNVTRRALAGTAAVVALTVVAGAALPAVTTDEILFDPASGGVDSPATDPEPSDGMTGDRGDEDAGAADGQGEDVPPSSTRTATCEGEQEGVQWTLQYPSGWWAPDEPGRACRLFHPVETSAPDDADRSSIGDVAVWVGIDRTSYEETLEDVQNDRILERRDAVVDGRRATIVEVEVLSEAGSDVPVGSHVYGYLVDLDGATLVLATSDVLTDDDYGRYRTVVDVMAESLRLVLGDLEAAAARLP